MKRLLVVDDSRAIRSFLESRLSPFFELTLAEDGQQALEKALQNPPHLVLSDVNMPRLNGFQLHAQLRRELPQQPIALMTDANIDEYLTDALTSEVSHIIAKASFRADFDGTLRLLRGLEQPHSQGLEGRLGPGGEVRAYIIGSAEDVPNAIDQCQRLLHRFPRRDSYLRILPELVRMALAEGWNSPGQDAAPGDYITLYVGADWQRVGFGVRDSAGRLSRQGVMEQLIRRAQQPVPVGPRDSGLAQARWLMDQCYITIKPQVFSEILCLDLLPGYKGHRSFHLREL